MKVNRVAAALGLSEWLDGYRAHNRDVPEEDAEFSRWLEEEYVPIAGGWMY